MILKKRQHKGSCFALLVMTWELRGILGKRACWGLVLNLSGSHFVLLFFYLYIRQIYIYIYILCAKSFLVIYKKIESAPNLYCYNAEKVKIIFQKR